MLSYKRKKYVSTSEIWFDFIKWRVIQRWIKWFNTSKACQWRFFYSISSNKKWFKDISSALMIHKHINEDLMTKTLKINSFAYIKTIHKQFCFHFKYCFQLKQHYKNIFQMISMHTLWHVSKILFQKCVLICS